MTTDPKKRVTTRECVEMLGLVYQSIVEILNSIAELEERIQRLEHRR